MANSLVEFIKTFSFASTLKGNVLSAPGGFGGSGAGGGMIGSKSGPTSTLTANNLLSTFYRKCQEIKDYERSDLTQTIVTILKDYIAGYFSKSGDLITIDSTQVSGAESAQEWLNNTLKELDIVHEVRDHLWDIIYEGSYSFQIGWDSEKGKYKKSNLQNPHNVVTVYQGSDQLMHLVVSRQGVIYKVKPDSIFRIGKADMTLINDMGNGKPTNGFKKDEDTLVREDVMRSSTPLYYNITGKVKEYLLKDQLLALLSIKDLIQPLILLLRTNNTTSPDESNKAAKAIERMINKHSDISSILSANFSINGLIDSLMNNVRVVPDYGGASGDLGNIDLTKITSKINEIEQTQDQKKEHILISSSIPRALIDGNSTKWDAIKSSQRLNSKVHGYILSITDSIKIEAIKLYKGRFGRTLPFDAVKVNLFTKTDVDFNIAITNASIVGELFQTLNQTIGTVNQTINEGTFIDKEKYLQWVMEKIKSIDAEEINFITEDSIKAALSAVHPDQEH